MVGEKDETFLGQRWTKDVAQESGTGVLVRGSCMGLGVQVEATVLHHEVAHDFGLAVGDDGHRLALPFGGARGWETGYSGCGQL